VVLDPRGLLPPGRRRYGLPPDFTKATDTRRFSFIAKWGDVSVELDALPIEVLRARIVAEVEARMDLVALAATRRQEEKERRLLVKAMAEAASAR
jgi:hypothetical protein